MAPKVQATSKPTASKTEGASTAVKVVKVVKAKAALESATSTTEVTPVTAVTPVATPAPVTVATPAPATETAEAENSRRNVTPESVDDEFSSILASIQAEFTHSKDTGQPVSKFLRTLNKRLAVLQRDTRRIAKGKRKTVGTAASENSGFMKKSRISPELAAFLGVAADTRMSRVECTSAIQEYITTNNLKNKTNGRVVEPNKDLTKLLGYKAKDHVDTTLNKAGQPKNPDGALYYWVIQKLIQRHFVADQ
jgi:chromatin remodeling complex protein RSC6